MLSPFEQNWIRTLISKIDMDPNENYNIIKETDIKQIIINNGENVIKRNM